MELCKVVVENRRAVAGGVGAYLVVLLMFAGLSQPGCAEVDGSVSFCWAWLTGSPFWGSFYGNLMSTFAGGGLGLWAALYLNGRAEATQRKQEREDGDRRRADEREATRQRHLAVLRIVADDARSLYALVLRTKEQLEAPRPGISTARFDIVTWSALSREALIALSSYGEDGISIALQLTKFYSTLQILQGHSERVFAAMFAKIERPSAHPDLQENYFQSLLITLKGDCNVHIVEFAALLPSLDELRSNIATDLSH